ncbi:MAG: MerR family transcriptional regulator [Oscillospiraceae bacterium]|nr:MerR family transcriptional regulator [Oscillospiraceae bacterium]
MLTVKQVSQLTGLSVRTLHHYDKIGLLRPARVSGAGYRLYDDSSLARLQSILLFRELRFSLKEICQLLDRPDFDPVKAIDGQLVLLQAQRQRLDELIQLALKIQTTGEITMNFKPFDDQKMEQYRSEAKARWGQSQAWQEYESREKAGMDVSSAGSGLLALLAELGQLRDKGPQSPEAQAAVARLQQYITDHFYTCTDQILQGLGQMYLCDERMKAAIDKAGGEGTADFASQAICAFTRGK